VKDRPGFPVHPRQRRWISIVFFASVCTISLNLRPSQREEFRARSRSIRRCPPGKQTLLPVIESLCNRTRSQGTAGQASGIVTLAIGVMNGIEHGPEHIAFKLERAARRRAGPGVFNTRALSRAPRQNRAALVSCGDEIIQPCGSTHGKIFECRESCCHQMRQKVHE